MTDRRRRVFSSLIVPALVALLAVALAAQEPPKRIDVRCITVPPPKIDGLIDDACWQAVEPVSGFYQYDPINGAKASEETFVWAAFDQDTLYFAFLMKDSQPDKIWAELTPRNEWDENDADRAHPRRLQRQADEHHFRRQSAGRPEELRRDDLAVRGGHAPGRLERRDGHPLQVAPLLGPEARHLGRQLRALHPPPQRDGLLDGRRPRPAPAPADRRALRPDRPPARLQPRVLPLRRGPDVQAGRHAKRHQGRGRPRRQVGHQAQPLSRRHGQPGFQRGRIRPLHPAAVPLRELPQEHRPFFTEGSRYFSLARRGRIPRR